MIDFGGLFGARSHAKPRVTTLRDNTPSAITDPVRVSIQSLLELRRAATGLILQSHVIRARQGGTYLSTFKGLGMEFDEARPYQAGDDVRHLDWRVTARTGRAHTKLFREERERPVLLWVDYRASMFFATRGAFKAVLAARAASLLAWSAKHHGDRVGSIIFSENVHKELKPRRGHAGVMHLIGALSKHPAWNHRAAFNEDNGSLRQAFQRLQRVARPGSLIFLISDFRHFDDSVQSQLAHMGRHCNIVMLMIHDPLERHLPPAGHYRLSNGLRDIDIDTSDQDFRRHYARRFKEHQRRFQTQARLRGFQFLSCSTSEDPLDLLRQGLDLSPPNVPNNSSPKAWTKIKTL
jgi:uncharacterized protein (DUF58 family)